MSGAQHTPGPWSVDGCQIVADQGAVALGLYGDIEDPDQTTANIRLIAAAPDLLAALKAAEADIVAWLTNGAHTAAEIAEDDVIRQVRAAIAKAEGRT